MCKKAPKGSGVFGIFVKGELLLEFDIKTIYITYDGILSLQFRHEFTEYTFMVISCYLAPQNSTWSNTTDFYSHLISQIYSDIDGIYIAGDFNSLVKDTQFCVLNGRVTPEYNDFTYINGRGKSVVDYILVLDFR